MAIRNKAGILRTLEAALAIAVLLGLLYVIIPEPEKATGDIPYEIRNAESFILTHIESDDALRSCVMASKPGICSCTGLNTLIDDNTPLGYESQCEICDTAVTCTDANQLNLPLDKAVYTDSILITKDNKAKVARVYFYEA